MNAYVKLVVLLCGALAVVAGIELSPVREAAAGRTLQMTQATATLDELEKEGLIWMREEEKLARDVYLAMYARYGTRVFSNIIESEQRHMDVVKRLLDKYGIDDPSSGKEPGEFTNPAFTAFYADCVARGGQSLAEAYNVGVSVEKADIADLQAQFLIEGLNVDIKRVYTNLLAASMQHLRAFQTQIERLQ